jgi:hypothetical protein
MFPFVLHSWRQKPWPWAAARYIESRTAEGKKKKKNHKKRLATVELLEISSVFGVEKDRMESEMFCCVLFWCCRSSFSPPKMDEPLFLPVTDRAR